MPVDFGHLIVKGKKENYIQPDVIPTGISKIDKELLGIGGFPRGRVSEISSFESQGKTTLLLIFIGIFQRQGYKCFVGDAEGTITKEWAELCGVIWDELDIIPQMPAEDFLNTLKMVIASDMYDFGGIDSISVFAPDGVVRKKDIGDVSMKDMLMPSILMKNFLNGLQSGFTIQDAAGKAINGGGAWILTPKGEKFDKSIHLLRNKKVHIMFVAHLAEKVGLSFGDPYYTSGGKKKDFIYTFRFRLSASKRTKKVKGKDVFVGKNVNITLWKSKISVPYKKVPFYLTTDGKLIDEETPIEEVTEEEVKNIENESVPSFIEDK